MKKLRELWLRLLFGSEKQSIEKGKKIFAATLQRLLVSCPICQGDFQGHKFADFAFEVFREEQENQINELLTALRQHRWSNAHSIRNFDPMCNAVIAHTLYCPCGNICWIVTMDPYDIDDVPTVIEYEVLDFEESQKLGQLINQDEWIPLL
jgi:hypothetical protein